LDAIKSLRKDRTSELKVDKERLDSLSREKAHADKHKARMTELTSTIVNKEVEYEATGKTYQALVVANQKFYDYATRFREVYLRIQSLEEQKSRFEADLEEAKLNLQEEEGAPIMLIKRSSC
jgi:DNA repair protein RAD50